MMHTVTTGLYASPPEQLPFAPSLEIRAFLLRRERRNLLVYTVGALPAEAQAIEELGGVSRHYLNHWHEAQFGCDRVAKAFHAPLFCHENEREAVSKKCEVTETFSERHMLDDVLEVIPTRDTRAGRAPSCGTPGSIAVCSPATPSIFAKANGSRRCSSRATVAAISKAWTSYESSILICSCRGWQRAAKRSTP
jgi:hypothetical protein